MLWNSPCRVQLPHNGRDVSSLDSTQSQHFRTNKDREFPSSRGWKSKIKAVAGLASWLADGYPLDLSLCGHSLTQVHQYVSPSP